MIPSPTAEPWSSSNPALYSVLHPRPPRTHWKVVASLCDLSKESQVTFFSTKVKPHFPLYMDLPSLPSPFCLLSLLMTSPWMTLLLENYLYVINIFSLIVNAIFRKRKKKILVYLSISPGSCYFPVPLPHPKMSLYNKEL